MFKYLGRLLAFDDNDMPAIRGNLKKARKCWARLSRLLTSENASPRVSGMFFEAVVQAVLLFGSETWNITPSSMKCLEGFQLRCAYRMAKANKPSRDPLDDTWAYPRTEDVLEECGLHSIAHYIEVRRQTVARYIVDRPIFTFCMEQGRRRGTSACRQWWWEQPMDLDLARDEAAASSDVAEDDGSD